MEIKKHNFLGRFSIIFFSILTLVLWSTPLFTTPTFDLDEALYRQFAQEMKTSHNYFKETWSGENYYDKPPTHLWSIIAVSKLIDSDENKVSVLASKIPSLFATYLTIFFACLFWVKSFPLLSSFLTKRGYTTSKDGNAISVVDELKFPLLPALFFGFALLPTAGSSSVIVDPMLLAAFSPFFLCLTHFYIKGNGKITSIPFSCKIIIVLSIVISCMLKGPIGLLLPAMSVVFHEAVSFLLQKEESPKLFFKNRVLNYIKLFFPIFFIALILSALYFVVIYIYAGKDFIYNFFIVQNLQRGLHPMENHGGSFFYHWIVVFIGGFFLTPTIVYYLKKILATDIRQRYNFWGYPLSWCLTFILFFGFMSTKLPNYTWPVWISLCILMPILLVLCLTDRNLDNIKNKGYMRYLLFFVPFVICIALFSTANIVVYLVNHMHFDPRVKVVMNTILPIPLNVKIAFIISGFILFSACFYCFKFISQQKNILKNIVIVSFLNSLFIFTLCIGIVPFVKNVYWLPFVRNTEFVQEQILQNGGTFATMGINSPTVSSSFTLFNVTQYSKNDDNVFKNKITYILLPKWLDEKCTQYGYKIVRKDYYLSVCKI